MNLKDILFNPDDGDNGYFLEVDLLHPPKIKEETKKFPFAPEKKSILITLHPTNGNKPNAYTQTKS